MRVLVVDDEQLIRQAIAVALDPLEIVEAADGVEAIEQLASNDIGLLLLDISLPGVNGFDVLKYVRAQPATADLPIICISAYGREADHIRGYTAGADAYIIKPFGFDALAEMVRLVTSLSPEQRRAHRAGELERAKTLHSIESLLG